MSILASCGHEIDNATGYFVEEKDHEKDWTPCTSILVLCEKCYRKHKRWGIVIRSIGKEDWGRKWIN